jgi:hypothetical protein
LLNLPWYVDYEYGRDDPCKKDYRVEGEHHVTAYLVLTLAGIQLPQTYARVTIKQGIELHTLHAFPIWDLTARRVKRIVARHDPTDGYATSDETTEDELAVDFPSMPSAPDYPGPPLSLFAEMGRGREGKSYVPLAFLGLQEGGMLEIAGDDD